MLGEPVRVPLLTPQPEKQCLSGLNGCGVEGGGGEAAAQLLQIRFELKQPTRSPGTLPESQADVVEQHDAMVH